MRIYIMLVLLFCGTTAISQHCNNTLSGNVIDLHDGSVLAGATLIIAGTEQAVMTDEDGNYTFTGLCNQRYAIQVSHPFCVTRGFKVRVSGNTVKNFRLEHHLEELNEVTVQGKAYGDKSKSMRESEIATDELERYQSGSLGDALNSLPGVSSLNTGNAVVKPLINGLHSSRVVVINNGVRMEDQEWGAEHAPSIDINTAGNITLIKGAGALQYGGNAVGGVIIAEAPKVQLKDSLYGKTLLTAASNGRGGTLSSQLTKSYHNGWYGTVQGTLKRFGDFEAADYVLSNTGVFERNASLRIGLNQYKYGLEGYYTLYKSEFGILRASHLGGAQDQVRANQSDRPLIINDFTYNIDAPKQEVTHHLFRLKGFMRIKELGKLSLQYDFQDNNRLEFDIRRGDDRNNASLDLELKTHTLLLDLDTQASENLNLKAGIMGKYQNNFADPDTGVRRLIPDYDKYDLGLYAIADYRLNDQWLLEAGGRFDYTFMDVFKFYRTSFWEQRNYGDLFPEIVVEELDNQVLTNPELKFYNPSATAGVTYSLGAHSTVFFNYSLASRAPNPSELFSEGLHHSASRIEYGDLRFDSEWSHKFSLTFERKGDRFRFSVNPYINTIQDFIVIEPVGIQQTIRGNFQVWEYRQTRAQLLGADIDASYALNNNIHLKHQLALVKGYDRSRDRDLIHMPPVNTQNEIVYQNERYHNLRLALQSNYTFRQNDFPDNNFEVFIPETGSSEIVDVSTPPGAYHLLNFDAEIDVKLNPKSTLRLGVGINNIFNTSYRNYLNRLRLYADDSGRNFLIRMKINY